MKGKYHFRVKSKRALFDFTIRRNITILKGDSATGKTTLLHMLYEYLRVGRQSGYSVSTNADYFVYLRKEVGRDWKDTLFPLKNTIIFIEENNDFVFGKDFADFVKTSGNYFVLVNRAPFRMLPYSIHEIYEIITAGKKADIKESYHEFKELYSNYPIAGNNKIKNIITEDSHSGYQFLAEVFKKANTISADGNSNIIHTLQEVTKGDTLVIADGAAFGAMIENCLAFLDSILEEPADHVDSLKYESWEQFFTDLLITLTKDTTGKYAKETLNKFYLQEKNMQKIMEQFPDVIKNSTLAE